MANSSSLDPGSNNSSTIYVWDTVQGYEIATLPGLELNYTGLSGISLFFCSNGNHFVSCHHQDNWFVQNPPLDVRVWDTYYIPYR